MQSIIKPLLRKWNILLKNLKIELSEMLNINRNLIKKIIAVVVVIFVFCNVNAQIEKGKFLLSLDGSYSKIANESGVTSNRL